MTFGRKGLSANPAPSPNPSAGAVAAPLFNGMQYVGMVSPPGAFLTGLSGPQMCLGPGNARGVRYDMETNEGPGYAFIFPSFASIWLHGEAAPRPQIPTEMIAARVPGYAAGSAALLRG
ncbi:hypothetical protein FHS95_003068 [Sphingomonas naasensis]|uniref:Uncharacterized protein n=1 Tax=Sphingomonas naasensis TaxID=1344951 RepID=A0A4S1W7G0_9SPHN|nr:hypothetical protein [Sphingomonas naasensis]NIJ21365.1 hypothetical protein [Sphingomonas naasensis]TGX38791.1 hypothetical protein E5A74_18365 [Sphingomonas naasensis]